LVEVEAMSTATPIRELIATVDSRELNSLRRGPLLQMFPAFVEEIELGRYLKKLLASMRCCAVELAPHVGSSHIFDVFVIHQ
jgi:hypothetical protein